MEKIFVYLSSENVQNQNSKAIASNVLPIQIDAVDKQWEVSLIKTAITHYWDNVVNICISVMKIEEDGTKNVLDFQVENGLYTRTEKLYNRINQALIDALQLNDSPDNW